MKFNAFKEFRSRSGAAINDIAGYLSGELAQTLLSLRTGLSQLSFEDNFQSFEVTVDLPGNTEVPISNLLRKGTIPTKWILLRQNAVGRFVCDGDSPWTESTVYLKNTHATDPARITVVFLV